MRLKIFIVLAVVLWALPAFAQAVDTVWVRR